MSLSYLMRQFTPSIHQSFSVGSSHKVEVNGQHLFQNVARFSALEINAKDFHFNMFAKEPFFARGGKDSDKKIEIAPLQEMQNSLCKFDEKTIAERRDSSKWPVAHIETACFESLERKIVHVKS